jgi:hypothetical protein
LVVWPQTFEKFRRIVMGASMLAVKVRIQREGEVVHLVASQLTDLSAELATVGSRDAAFPLPHGRGDQVRQAGGGPDPRELPPKGLRTRDLYTPDLHIDTIKVRAVISIELDIRRRRRAMIEIRLLAEPKGNGYQAMVSFPDGVSISSAETYPTIAEAMTAAALKLLEMTDRLEALDRAEQPAGTSIG